MKIGTGGIQRPENPILNLATASLDREALTRDVFMIRICTGAELSNHGPNGTGTMLISHVLVCGSHLIMVIEPSLKLPN